MAERRCSEDAVAPFEAPQEGLTVPNTVTNKEGSYRLFTDPSSEALDNGWEVGHVSPPGSEWLIPPSWLNVLAIDKAG